VDFDQAMRLSTAWACVRLLSETVASLPLEFERESDVSRLFAGRVNRYQTAPEFLECQLLNLTTTGNAYARRDYRGNRLVALTPLNSNSVETILDDRHNIIHRHYQLDGTTRDYQQSEIWHLKLFGDLAGLSPIGYGADFLSLAREN